MHTGIVACDVHAPLGAVARMMAHRIHCVVVRNSAMGGFRPRRRSLGRHLPDLDFVRLVATDAVGRPDFRAKAPQPGSCRRRARLRSGGGPTMADNDVTHLVVVNHAAKPVGVFSTLDVAQAVSDAIHVPR